MALSHASVFAAAFTIFPASKRNIVSPMIGLIATLAPTVGPTVGGYLSHTFSWHWLFLVNVPAGILVSLGALALIDFDGPDWSLFNRFDWLGLGALACFLGGMEFVLEEGPGNDWFQDEAVAILFAVMVVGGILTFWRAVTRRDPVVDLSAFANTNFAVGSVFSFVLGIGLYGLTYIYPVYLARVRGYSALMIGETMFVSGLCMFATAPIAGRLSGRVDPRIMMGIGFVGFACGTWIVTGLTKDWDFYELLWPQVLRGCSLMLCMIPINNIALGTLPPERMKNASGLFNLTRNLGGAVGLALINTILNARWDLHLARLHERFTWANTAALERLDAMRRQFEVLGGDANGMALKALNNTVRIQGLVMGFEDVFLVLTGLFLAMACGTPLIRRPRGAAPAGAGH